MSASDLSSVATDWPRIGRDSTLSEQVYQAVRERLLARKLKPGSFIREKDLCKALAVSRTPVREALNRLASEGFLERKPQRGFWVPEQSMEDLLQLFPVLHALEVLAGEFAFPQMTEEDCARLEEVNRRFEAALDAGQVRKAVELNDRFHHLLGEMSGNPILCSYLDDMRTQVRRLELWDYSQALRAGMEGAERPPTVEWVRQHEGIIASVRGGDYKNALEILKANRQANALFILTAGARHVGDGPP